MFILQLLGEACSYVLGIDVIEAIRLNMLEIPPEDLDLLFLVICNRTGSTRTLPRKHLHIPKHQPEKGRQCAFLLMVNKFSRKRIYSHMVLEKNDSKTFVKLLISLV